MNNNELSVSYVIDEKVEIKYDEKLTYLIVKDENQVQKAISIAKELEQKQIVTIILVNGIDVKKFENANAPILVLQNDSTEKIITAIDCGMSDDAVITNDIQEIKQVIDGAKILDFAIFNDDLTSIKNQINAKQTFKNAKNVLLCVKANQETTLDYIMEITGEIYEYFAQEVDMVFNISIDESIENGLEIVMITN